MSSEFTILIFSVPAGTEFCEAAVKWKSVADFYPQGVRGIRKAAKLPTAAQDCRARRQIMLNLFWRDRKWIAAEQQEKPPWGVCVPKNSSRAASVEP